VEASLWDVGLNRDFSPSAEVLEALSEACTAAGDMKESLDRAGESDRLKAMAGVASAGLMLLESDDTSAALLKSSGNAIVQQLEKSLEGSRYKMPSGVRRRDAARVLSGLCKHAGLGIEMYLRCTASAILAQSNAGSSVPVAEAQAAASSLLSLPLGSRMQEAWKYTRNYCRHLASIMSLGA